MQLEREWLAFVELQIVNVRLRRDLQLLAIDDFLKCFLHERFDDLLANRILEALLDQLRRRLAGAKAGEPHARRITSRRFFLCLTNCLDRHLYLEEPLDAFALLRRDLNVHVS